MSTAERQADVVVVGGGPAGSAAAITCAAFGLSVLLLEGNTFPRDAPGEALHPGVEALFERLGVAAEIWSASFIRHPGYWVDWEGSRQFVAFGQDAKGPWLGLQAWRAELDTLLLDRAKALGVEVHHRCRALRPLRGEHLEVMGVETSSGPIRAQVVIDAAGSSHWLARHLELLRLEASPRLVASYGYVVDPGGEEGSLPSLVADDEGWTWMARVRPGVRQWTRLTLDGRPVPAGWRPAELKDHPPLGRTRGADVTWRRIEAPAGPGYLLVGDAAAVLDPASSHGVLKALMSGMMAGHAVGRALSGALSWPMALDGYAEWVRRWFEHDVVALRERYRRFPGWAARSLEYSAPLAARL